MAYSELTQQAISGLQSYRQALVNTHREYTGAVDAEEVRDRLAQEGVTTASPLVTIPYTLEYLERAAALSADHPWTDPSTTERIDRALSVRKLRDEGNSAYEAGFPTPFYTNFLDVAVVFDDTELNAEDFGKLYAYGLGIHFTAHEITHSAFSRICSSRYQKVGADKIRVHATDGIGQAVDTITMWPGGGRENSYQPIWIDEAFAQHMAAKVRTAMLPESMPKDSQVFDFEYYRATEVEVPPKYLIRSDEFPEDSGNSPSAGVEGIGIDVLAEKRPWLLPQIKAVCIGTLAVADFHQNLLNGVGQELYEDIVQRRPYTTWGRILDAIMELDKS